MFDDAQENLRQQPLYTNVMSAGNGFKNKNLLRGFTSSTRVGIGAKKTKRDSNIILCEVVAEKCRMRSSR